MTVFDDGTGPALYAGGTFYIFASGAPGYGVAKWDGSSWSPLGTGINDELGNTVNALAVFDDGSGPALYAGGRFTTAGGLPANYIARWNGTSWSPLGSGVDQGDFFNGTTVNALAVFDDGSGPALYAGGNFTLAGGSFVNNIARWNGSAWSSVALGLAAYGTPDQKAGVYALTVFDDGKGPALYAGGNFMNVLSDDLNNIARWNGVAWSALTGSNGLNGVNDENGLSYRSFVEALTVFDDGSGPALFVGGQFAQAGGNVSKNIAKWQGCPATEPCTGDFADDFGLTAAEGGGPDGFVDFGDFAALLGLIGPCAGGTPGCLGDIADDFGLTADEGGGPDGIVDLGDFAALLGLIGPCL